MKLAPAILVHDKATFDHQLSLAREMTDRMQLDFIDGVFADNKTLALDELQFPPATQVDLDMMVAHPSEHVTAALQLQPHLIVWHFECEENLSEVINRVKAAGVQVGVALNPDTAVETIAPLLPQVDHVLIMGVAAGFAGQAFEPSVLEKASALRQLKPELELGLDGGQNQTTVDKAVSAGIDILYINTALFGAPDPMQSWQQIQGVIA